MAHAVNQPAMDQDHDIVLVAVDHVMGNGSAVFVQDGPGGPNNAEVPPHIEEPDDEEPLPPHINEELQVDDEEPPREDYEEDPPREEEMPPDLVEMIRKRAGSMQNLLVFRRKFIIVAGLYFMFIVLGIGICIYVFWDGSKAASPANSSISAADYELDVNVTGTSNESVHLDL